MNATQYKYKTVGWAYPTSEAAARFGLGHCGCWVVERTNPGCMSRVVSGHLDVRDAMAAAEALPEPWDPMGHAEAQRELERLKR